MATKFGEVEDVEVELELCLSLGGPFKKTEKSKPIEQSIAVGCAKDTGVNLDGGTTNVISRKETRKKREAKQQQRTGEGESKRIRTECNGVTNGVNLDLSFSKMGNGYGSGQLKDISKDVTIGSPICTSSDVSDPSSSSRQEGGSCELGAQSGQTRPVRPPVNNIQIDREETVHSTDGSKDAVVVETQEWPNSVARETGKPPKPHPNSNGNGGLLPFGQMPCVTSTGSGHCLFSESMALSAKEVGDAFANLYYHLLQNSPELLCKFYKDHSTISRPGPDGTMRASTLPDIIEDLHMLASGGFDSVEVTSVTSQDSQSGGILVAVDGYFTFNERREREFTQSFFLAPQETGYFVRNDMFMSVERSEAEASITPANNAICVKNLPPYATIDLVENTLKQFGDIRRGGCELRHKEGFSYGFVEFKEAKAAQKAIEASPIMIDESITYVEKKRPDYRSYWETPSSGPGNIYGSVEMRGTQALESMEEVRGTKPPGNNNDESQKVSEPNDETGNGNNQESQAVPEDAGIFVKNLPPNVTIALVENAFKQFGEIRSGGIKVHKTKKCCFVEFEEADAAKRAIMESPIMIDGSTCYVEKKLPGYKTVTECSGIHLKNLPLTATSSLIEDAFKKFGPIKREGITIKTTNLEHSYGFVEFEEADAAKRAIKASPVKIDGKYVHVEWQKAKAKQRVGFRRKREAHKLISLGTLRRYWRTRGSFWRSWGSLSRKEKKKKKKKQRRLKTEPHDYSVLEF